MKNPAKAAVLWTGGKDSALALHVARAAGYVIDRLITFAPARPDFLAHPVAVMQAQAQSLGLEHQIITIGPDTRADYRAAIARLRERDGVNALITGDIDLVDGLPSFIRQCCEGLDVDVVMPLWQRDRPELMHEMIELGFEAVFSLVKRPWLSADWLGRRIDAACLEELQSLHRSAGLDVCGENGEYHTLVLSGPGFARRVKLALGEPRKTGDMSYLSVSGACLETPDEIAAWPPADNSRRSTRCR